MIRYFAAAGVVLFVTSIALRGADGPAGNTKGADTQAAGAPDESDVKKLDPADLKALTAAIGAPAGVTQGKVHTLVLPRSDLDVINLDMGEIPTEAGLATTLHVFRCGCGKYYVIGDFCVTDYESNDVIDALRSGHFPIVSVSPILLQERPRLLSIRFQGEGQMDEVIKTLKEAVRWVGENRTKRNPIKD